jgi:hypothetical protein
MAGPAEGLVEAGVPVPAGLLTAASEVEVRRTVRPSCRLHAHNKQLSIVTLNKIPTRVPWLVMNIIALIISLFPIMSC